MPLLPPAKVIPLVSRENRASVRDDASLEARRPPEDPRVGSSGIRPPSRHAPTLDDNEIVAGVRARDPRAAEALHDRARPLIERTILRLLGRRDREHEDLVQVSLIELMRSLHGYRGECSLDTWTARVTAHVVFKTLRRWKGERSLIDPTADLARIDVSKLDPERAMAMRSCLQRVQSHLAALHPLKAWTLVLHDVNGYDLREIAEITESTISAAQSRLVRGRKELHARIEDDPELRDFLDHMRGST